MPREDRIKLRHLHSLVAIAEHGSLVRAAQAMSITQPAVSKTLAELEDIVGQRLVDRRPRGVELTNAGRLFLRYAGSSVRTIRDGLDSLARADGAEAPVILIGVLPNVAATILPKAVVEFVSRVPKARISVRTGSNAQLIAALAQHQIDIVVGRLAEPAEMRSLRFEQLYQEVLVLVTRLGHPLSRRRRLAPSSLAAYSFVLPDIGTRIREAADRWFLASGLGCPANIIETIDVSFGRNYVSGSDAIWFVPFGVVEDDVSHGVLRRLEIDTDITRGEVGISLRADTPLPESLQTLVEEVRRAALDRLRLRRPAKEVRGSTVS